jgi:hypothetical protein
MMSVMCKRTAESNEKKTYQSTDRVTVLGLVCEKMSELVVFVRQEEEERRTRQEVSSITQDDTVDEEDLKDDEGVQDEREIWEVTHVSEQDFETTEGEGVDLLSELLDLVG